MEHGTDDVEDITEKPGDDEEERQAVGRCSAEVFNDLRREDNNPAGNGYGAEWLSSASMGRNEIQSRQQLTHKCH